MKFLTVSVNIRHLTGTPTSRQNLLFDKEMFQTEKYQQRSLTYMAVPLSSVPYRFLSENKRLCDHYLESKCLSSERYKESTDFHEVWCEHV
jgi:hypothetical protein